MTTNNNQELRAKAFDEFKKMVAQETRGFAYNIAYDRLVPQFSTASLEETKHSLVVIRGAARLGHNELALELGTELYHWARDNGYSHTMP